MVRPAAPRPRACELTVSATGFSILMFIFTMWIMLQNRRRRSLNRGMLSAACALLVLSTAVCLPPLVFNAY